MVENYQELLNNQTAGFDYSTINSWQNSNSNVPGVVPGAWQGTFRDWSNVAGMGLGALNTYTAFDAGKTAKKNLALQEEQMRKNWAATRATAQAGIENNLRQEYIRSGATSQEASDRARANSSTELNRYGLV